MFGSVASQKNNQSSDVDLAILFDNGFSAADYFNKRLIFMDDLSRLLDKEIDVVILNNAPVFSRLQIIKNGRRVYEMPNRDERTFEARTIVEYFDYLPTQQKLERALINQIRRR